MEKIYDVVVLANTRTAAIMREGSDTTDPIRVTTMRNLIATLGMPHVETYRVHFTTTHAALKLLDKNSLSKMKRKILLKDVGMVHNTDTIAAWRNLLHCLENERC